MRPTGTCILFFPQTLQPVPMFAFCQCHRGAEEPLGPVRLLQLVCVSIYVCINGSGFLQFIPGGAAASSPCGNRRDERFFLFFNSCCWCFTVLVCPDTKFLHDRELQKRTELAGMKERGMEKGPWKRVRDAQITGTVKEGEKARISFMKRIKQ